MNQTKMIKIFLAFMVVFLIFDIATFSLFSIVTVPFYLFMIYYFGTQINLWNQLKYKINVKLAKYRK